MSKSPYNPETGYVSVPGKSFKNQTNYGKTSAGNTSVTGAKKQDYDSILDMFVTEEEKYADDKQYLKRLVNYYDLLGRNQISQKKQGIVELRDLANGLINKNDFIDSEEVKELQLKDPTIKFDENDMDLEFFGLTPNIINRLVGELDKKYLKFHIRAVNPEAKNELVEKRNKELLDILKASYLKVLEGGVDPDKVQAMVEEKFKYYASDYRHEVEQWANHLMEVEDGKYNMRQFERKVFKENLIHEEPFVHVNYQDNHYYPEIWQPEDVFYLKSKGTTDASDYIMIGKYSYLDIANVLNKYSLDEEQIETIKEWQIKHTGASLAVHGDSLRAGYGFNHKESLQNYLALKTIDSNVENYSSTRRIIRETIMYMLVPKKVGVLTTVINGETFVTEVDETFKVTLKPEYSTKEKDKEFLIAGEHVEWTYINELFQVVKLDLDFGGTYMSNESERRTIWIKLAPHDIQYKHRNLRYGVRIPVHGGSELGWSITSKTKPWQKFYNYIWNRNKQLLSTETGKFLLLNQNLIPQTSYDGSWGEFNFLKAFLSARDISMMPIDPSLTNTGQNQTMGFGQVVDLEKTGEVINKAQLANIIKQECYDSIGLNPQFLADISPYQSAKSVAAGNQVTVTQLQYLYSKHYDIMKAVRETMIETALFLTSKGEMRDLNYVQTDGQRIAFTLSTENTLMYDLGLFLSSDPADLINLEIIKQIAIQDNTMGSDAYEKMKIIASNTTTELAAFLKENSLKREDQVTQQRKHEQDMLDKQIAQQNQDIEKKLRNDNEQAQLDREFKLNEARIKALGYANDTADTISNEIKEMSEYNLKQSQFEYKKEYDTMKLDLEQQKINQSKEDSSYNLDLKERMELEKIALRKQELDETKKKNIILAKKPTAK